MPVKGYKSLTIRDELYSQLCNQAVNYGITPQILLKWILEESTPFYTNNEIHTRRRVSGPPTRSAFRNPGVGRFSIEKEFGYINCRCLRSPVRHHNNCGDIPWRSFNLRCHPGQDIRRTAAFAYDVRATISHWSLHRHIGRQRLLYAQPPRHTLWVSSQSDRWRACSQIQQR